MVNIQPQRQRAWRWRADSLPQGLVGNLEMGESGVVRWLVTFGLFILIET